MVDYKYIFSLRITLLVYKHLCLLSRNPNGLHWILAQSHHRLIFIPLIVGNQKKRKIRVFFSIQTFFFFIQVIIVQLNHLVVHSPTQSNVKAVVILKIQVFAEQVQKCW